jgi:hypothetical protein
MDEGMHGQAEDKYLDQPPHRDDLRVDFLVACLLGPLDVWGVDRSWVGTFVPSDRVYPLILTILWPLAVSAIVAPLRSATGALGGKPAHTIGGR